MKFTWDPQKEAANLARHGVDFTTAQKAFADPRALVAFDDARSTASELRWWLLGRVAGRVLLVRYTHRPRGLVRIIGAGFWRKGEKRYEQTK